MGASVAQITAQMPDLLGPYFVRFGPPITPWWRPALRVVRQGVLGAGLGWFGSQALAGDAHPVFAYAWPVFLAVILYPNLAMKMSHDIGRARMYQTSAHMYLAIAAVDHLVHPRTELGAQTL